MNSVEAVEEYLNERYDKIPHYSRYVGEFIEEYPRGTYLVTMPRTYYSDKKWYFI